VARVKLRFHPDVQVQCEIFPDAEIKRNTHDQLYHEDGTSGSSETLVSIYQTTWRHIREGRKLNYE
jgi:hypothetical protein